MKMHGLEKMLGRSTIEGWQMRAGIEVFAKHCADALGLSGIRVTWTRNTETAAISQGGDLYLSNVRDSARIARPLFIRYVGFVVHELLHRRYTDWSAGRNCTGAFLAAMHNAVEDVWIERAGIRDGFVGNISGVLTDLITGMVVEALAAVSDWTDPKQYPFVMAVHGRRYAPPIPMADGLRKIFDEASTRIDACATSWDTLAVAQWIVDQLQLPPAADSQPDNTHPNPNPDQGKPAQGDSQPGDQGKPDQGKPADGKPTDGKPTDGQPQEGPGKPQEGQPAGTGAGKGKGDTDGPPSPGQRRSIAGAFRDIYEVEPTIDPGSARDKNLFCEADSLVDSARHLWPGIVSRYAPAPVSAKLRTEVRRIFDNSGTSEWSMSRKTGAVHPGALASTAAGNVRPFKQRRDTEGVDSAVVLLVDVSSSMSGDRAMAAVPACAALLETLAAAGVDVAILAFNGVCSIIKPWAMPTRKALTLLHRLKIEGGTRDYSALRHAHGLLLRHPAQRRVVFALSDGDGDVGAARAQNISAARLGITTIGVGIRHDVSAVYQQCVRVDDLADLGRVMFKHIKLAA
jgi:hypothetical protein